MTTAVAPDRSGPAGHPDPSKPARDARRMKSPYPTWFYIPAAVLFLVFFAVPTFASFYFSLTRWTLFDVQFIGFDNFVQFFQEPQLVTAFINTFIYGFVTSAAKVVLGLALALLLTGPILGRGYLRGRDLLPGAGLHDRRRLHLQGAAGSVPRHREQRARLPQPARSPAGTPTRTWRCSPSPRVDVWKGVGIATLIFMAGIVAIPHEYFEAARMDGAGAWSMFRNITLPLVRPATATVIILSLIGGLRSFELIWAITKGGPGFTSDVIASVIYKQYQAGFFGLSTAGNVILFIVVIAVMVPVSLFLNRREAEL